jgi:hypothetical protein
VGQLDAEAGHNWLGLDISAAMLGVAVEREVRRGGGKVVQLTCQLMKCSIWLWFWLSAKRQ